MANDDKRINAESRFARTQKRADDASQAMKDAQAEVKRVEDNTQRLRALRLAKEAADRAEAAANPPPARSKAKAKPKPKVKAAKSIPVEDLNAEDDV
jgi:hypothetical protein